MTHQICDACETVAHCLKHGCIPLTPQEPVTRTMEFRLRAMAKNYSDGHIWDELDGITCAKAADEISRLRAALALHDREFGGSGQH